MQVSVEKMSNIKYRLAITVEASQLEQATNKQFDSFARKANIKGFRPGKVPMSYIKQQFGEAARQEATNEIIKDSFIDAIKKENLTPLNTPEIELKSIEEGQPFEFFASFEVLPEIDAVHFQMDSFEKWVVDVKEADVQYAIDQLRKQHAKWTPVTRPAQEKDRVVIDYYPIFEDKAELDKKVQAFTLELGSHTMITGFEEQLIGASAGEQKTLNLQFPDNHSNKEKAGKSVSFVVDLREVIEADMPPLDDAFALQLGVKEGTVAALQNEIKQILEKESVRLVRENQKDQIFKCLLTQNDIELPSSLVEEETKRIHDEMYPPHQPHDHHQHTDAEMASFSEIAKKRVALGLLVGEYVKKNNISVDEDLVFAKLRDIAAAYEDPQAVIKWLSSKEKLNGIRAQALEDQVLDHLTEKVTAVEKTISYAELKGIRLS